MMMVQMGERHCVVLAATAARASINLQKLIGHIRWSGLQVLLLLVVSRYTGLIGGQ